MKITKAKELQNNFRAGLQIVGEDNQGRLEWMGEWDEVEEGLGECAGCGHKGVLIDEICESCREDLREVQIDNEVNEMLEEMAERNLKN